MPPSSKEKTRIRRGLACHTCRRDKKRCDGDSPCSRCIQKCWSCSNAQAIESSNTLAKSAPQSLPVYAAAAASSKAESQQQIRRATGSSPCPSPSDPTPPPAKQPRNLPALHEPSIYEPSIFLPALSASTAETSPLTPEPSDTAFMCGPPPILPHASMGELSAASSHRAAAMLAALHQLLSSVSYTHSGAAAEGSMPDPQHQQVMQVGGRKAQMALRSSSTAILTVMEAAGIPIHQVVRRLRVLLTSGNLQAVRAAAAASGGHLPLNLLAPVAPHLQRQLQALLVATSPGGAPPPRAALSEYVFDGLHLTLLGFAAAVTACGRGDDVVHVPAGCAVVQAPTHRVSASGDGGSADVRPLDDGVGYGVQPWSDAVPLSDLCDRWSHLSAVLSAAGEEEMAEATAVLQAQEQGRDADVPPLLLSLYIEFMQGVSVPMTHCVMSADPVRFSQAFGLNRASCTLNGYTCEKLVGGLSSDIDQDPTGQVSFTHPASALHQVISGLGASNSKLRAYQTYSQQLRRAVVPKDSPAQPRASLVPYFAVTTRHIENFPSGKMRCEVSYTSDIVMCRSPQGMCGMPTIADDLNLLENLLTPATTDVLPEVKRAMHSTDAAGKTEAMMQILDGDFCERAWFRLLMVARFEQDSLLNAYWAQQVLTEDTPGDPADTDPNFAAMKGVTSARLAALRSKFDQRLGQGILEMAVGCIAGCSEATAQLVPIYVGGLTQDLQFPGPRQTKMLLRFGL